MTFSYSFKSAFKSLCREKWINLLSILTVASSLLIITLTAFFLYNIEIIANSLPERFSIVAYLKDDLSSEETQAVIDTIKRRADIAGLKYISKEDAIKELQHTLKDTGYILEGLTENPLSSSIEIKLKKDFVTPSSAKHVAGEIKKTAGIDEVYYGEIIFLTISSGVIFVTYSTVKILFYRRKQEIEIIKLLGATKGFLRMPFLIEGGSIGFFGGLIGIIGAMLFYLAVTYRLSMVIPMLKTLLFPFEILVVLPLIGIMFGIIGSLIAIGRLKL